MPAPADDNDMPTHCRIYPSHVEARAAVDELLAAGHPGADIRVLMGSHEHGDDPPGAFAGDGGAAGAFAGGAGAPGAVARAAAPRRGGPARRVRSPAPRTLGAAGSRTSTARPSRATRAACRTSASPPIATSSR